MRIRRLEVDGARQQHVWRPPYPLEQRYLCRLSSDPRLRTENAWFGADVPVQLCGLGCVIISVHVRNYQTNSITYRKMITLRQQTAKSCLVLAI